MSKAQLDLGNLLLAGKHADDAEKRAQLVLAKHPDNAGAHALLANTLAAKGDNAAAWQKFARRSN